MMLTVLALAAAIQQGPSPVQLRRILDAHVVAARIGRTLGDSIWPGFRLDTIPVLYVLPDTGTLLLGWRGALPTGFAAIPGEQAGWQPAAERGAASTGTTLAGRPTAQVVAGGTSVADLVGLTAHEAFHVFEAASRRDGRRFGAGENSFLVSSYPIFDATNEAGIALEGRILAAALGAGDRTRRRELARQFVAARESRQRGLEDQFATFERLGELNEGLAEYALVRMRALALRDSTFAWARALDSLTSNRTQSIRLRFYLTGPAQARLLDAIEGPGWKARLMRDDLTLQETLATAAGWRDAEAATRRAAEAAFGMAALRAVADNGVAGLRDRRRAQTDSLLAAPGVQLVIALDSLPGRVGLCMIDPQNLLQADAGVLLHTRAVRVCAGAALDAMFTTPVVDARPTSTVRAVIGPADSITVTVGGKSVALADGLQLNEAPDLLIQSRAVTLTSRRADVSLQGRFLTVRPRP